MRRNISVCDKIFDTLNCFLLGLFSLITIFPFLSLITVSLSSPGEASRYGLHLLPDMIKTDAYVKVLTNGYIIKGYANTIIVTVIGTILSLLVSVLTAYPLSKKYLVHRNFWTGFIVFTMFFNGGLIPLYLIIRGLNLIDNRAVLILPVLINTFYMLIIRNFFQTLPDSVEEAAKIEGANDLIILFFIVLPMSLPIIATVVLWTMVSYWNAWFDCLIFMRDPNKFVLQVVLRRIVLEGSSQFIQFESINQEQKIDTTIETVKAATIMVATIPIMMVYPFVQKYFVKGIVMGSLKG